MARIQEDFVAAGYEVVKFQEKSDIIFINTCTVTGNADSDCRKIIRRAIRRNPEAFIAVVGCFAQLRVDDIRKIEGVDAILGNCEKFLALKLIKDFKKQKTPIVFVSALPEATFEHACSKDNDDHTRVFLKIQDGCDYYCSYCTVPYARGHSRSMDFNLISDYFKSIVASGFKEIVLSGINLGDYKSPRSGEDFLKVVKLIDRMEIPARVRISSIEPNLLTDEMIKIISRSGIICPHFHIPLQSGSDKILGLMKRRYKTDYFKDLINRINREMPDCCIGIDVITGYPGETDEDFQVTKRFIEQLQVSYLHVFTYSERQLPASSEMKGKISQQLKKQRTIELRELSEEKKAIFYQSQLGKVVTVIPEQFFVEGGSWRGWSENYVRVEFSGNSNIEKVPLRIRLIENRGEAVFGEVEK